MPKTNGHTLPVRGKSRTAKKPPTQQQIQLRAYEIYLERNGAQGNPLDDWVRAERELLHQNGKTKRTAKAAAV
jgi:Protein of unknown function (DUF2934)